MARQHPVAWLYFFTDRLLQEHLGSHPHAGFVSPMPWSWEHRQHLGHLVAISQQIVAGEAHEVRRELPIVARALIYPAVEAFHDAGDIDRARDWYTVFDAWRRPPSDDD